MSLLNKKSDDVDEVSWWDLETALTLLDLRDGGLFGELDLVSSLEEEADADAEFVGLLVEDLKADTAIVDSTLYKH